MACFGPLIPLPARLGRGDWCEGNGPGGHVENWLEPTGRNQCCGAAELCRHRAAWWCALGGFSLGSLLYSFRIEAEALKLETLRISEQTEFGCASPPRVLRLGHASDRWPSPPTAGTSDSVAKHDWSRLAAAS